MFVEYSIRFREKQKIQSFFSPVSLISTSRVLVVLASMIIGTMSGHTSAQSNNGSTGVVDESAKSHYVLDTGDRIFIQVFDEAELTMDALVNDSGIINYSYVGAIEVAGKTPVQIEQQITAILRDGYLVNPSVNVSIREYRPFFINGEVRRPGGYPYRPGLTVDRAIALAGGLTDRASRRKMYLERESDGASRKKVKMNHPVEPGDVITIDEGFSESVNEPLYRATLK